MKPSSECEDGEVVILHYGNAHAETKIGSVLGMIFAVPVGMIILNLYQAGAFDYILDDVMLLTKRIMELREPE